MSISPPTPESPDAAAPGSPPFPGALAGRSILFQARFQRILSRKQFVLATPNHPLPGQRSVGFGDDRALVRLARPVESDHDPVAGLAPRMGLGRVREQRPERPPVFPGLEDREPGETVRIEAAGRDRPESSIASAPPILVVDGQKE